MAVFRSERVRRTRSSPTTDKKKFFTLTRHTQTLTHIHTRTYTNYTSPRSTATITRLIGTCTQVKQRAPTIRRPDVFIYTATYSGGSATRHLAAENNYSNKYLSIYQDMNLNVYFSNKAKCDV